MTGKKYILTSDHFTGEVTFEYNLKGYLRSVKIGEVRGLSYEMFEWIWQNHPLQASGMDALAKEAGNFKITEVPLDLSFDRFWREYGNPASKKKYTESLWNQRTDAEKTQMLDFLPKYKNMKKMQGTQMVYASTYINQENWKV